MQIPMYSYTHKYMIYTYIYKCFGPLCSAGLWSSVLPAGGSGVHVRLWLGARLGVLVPWLHRSCRTTPCRKRCRVGNPWRWVARPQVVLSSLHVPGKQLCASGGLHQAAVVHPCASGRPWQGGSVPAPLHRGGAEARTAMGLEGGTGVAAPAPGFEVASVIATGTRENSTSPGVTLSWAEGGAVPAEVADAGFAPNRRLPPGSPPGSDPRRARLF